MPEFSVAEVIDALRDVVDRLTLRTLLAIEEGVGEIHTADLDDRLAEIPPDVLAEIRAALRRPDEERRR